MVWTIHVELHRAPKYSKRPDEFLPERWLVEPTHELFPVKDALRAFEYGPRNCIAQGIVMTELKMILACVVRSLISGQLMMSGIVRTLGRVRRFIGGRELTRWRKLLPIL